MIFRYRFEMENQRAIYHQMLSMIPICLNEFVLGIGFGWIAPMMKIFLDDPNSEIKPTPDECSWIASLALLGKAFGPVFSILLLDRIGRKRLLQLAAVAFFAMWLTILFSRSIPLLCVVLFVFGISVGISDAITAIYIGENCFPEIRGIFCGIGITCFYVAMLLQFILTAYLSYSAVAIISLVIVLSYLISTLLLVEPPQFLLLKDRFSEAEANLMWLNGTTVQSDVAVEFEKIKSNVAAEKIKKTSLKELFSASANYKSLIIVLILNIGHAATGSIVIISYVSILFPDNKFFTSDKFTIYFGILQLFSSMVSPFVIEKFDRRRLTLFSYMLFTICHSVNAFLYYNMNLIPVTYSIWIMFILVCIFSGCCSMTDSVVQMIRGELFPQSIKPFGSGVAIVMNSLTCFAVIKTFLMIKESYGIYMNFLIYATASFVTFIFSYFTLPETRGKSLIDIQTSMEEQK